MFTRLFGNKKSPVMPKLTPEHLMAIANIKNMHSWTPDAVELEKKAWQPLFVCCPLGKGGSEHEVIRDHFKDKDEDGKSHNTAVFTKDKFELWKVNMGTNTYTVPLVTKSRAATDLVPRQQQIGNVHSARIEGRLYKIKSELISTLDELRSNGVVYHRTRIDILHPYRLSHGSDLGLNRLSDTFIQPGRAWFYIGDQGLWEPQISPSHFSPAKLISPKFTNSLNSEPYYLYYPKEAYNSE